MGEITFIKGQGGLSRALPDEDHISAILVYHASKPTGFGTESIKQVTDLPDAEKKGITSDSTFKVLHYHISEFFRMNSGATLYVGVFAPEAPNTFDSIRVMQDYADGKIRQLGVYLTTAFNTTAVAALQTVASECEKNHKPLDILFSADISTITDLGTLPDLHTTTVAPDVAVLIGQDGSGTGSELFISIGKTIGCIGAALGAVSAAAVNECIGWVAKFNMASTELDVPAFGNGTLVKSVEGLINSLDQKGYIFLRKYTGIGGSYFNDSHTATEITSDYGKIESNRTIKKAMRGIRTYLLPFMNSNIRVDPESGLIAPADIATMENEAGKALEQMERARELSGYRVYINPDQDILSSSELEISVVNVPTGVIRKMKVTIGYAKKI